MASNLSGDQWNEGDVSCSVVRRVTLPDSFFAIDGLLESFLTIMQQFDIYPSVIEKENNYYLPFLLTTTILMEAVKNGGGREEVHEAIKEHAIATVRDLRNGKINENDLLDKLANDKRVGLSSDKLAEILKEKGSSSGLAKPQTTKFCVSVEEWKQKFPKAGDYKPGKIL
jgi:adenylosuccinate lyase